MMETPPRAWGRPGPILRHINAVRNTPTGVGKTEVKADPGKALEKHPHGRGDDWQMQGANFGLNRNTPTGVGKTGAMPG